MPDQGLKALTRHGRLPPSTSTLTKTETSLPRSPLYEQRLLLAQQKPDGGYDYHKPKNVPLYNGMILEKSEAVFLVEGEKDVDTLTKYGLPAVSLPNGAHWENEYVAYFSDKVIVILPDNDGAGRGYAKAALKALKPTNYNTGIMQLNNWWPEIPEGDVSDYIAAKARKQLRN